MSEQEQGVVAFSRRAIWPLATALLVVVLLRFVPLPWKHVFVVLFTAVLLAAAVAPAARFMTRYHVPRGVTIIVIYVAVVAVLAGIVALIVPLVISEVDALRAALPGYSEDVRKFIERVAPDQAQKFSGGDIASRLSNELGTLASTLTDIAVKVVSVGISVVLILVIAFFLAVEENFVSLVITRFVPSRQRPRAQRMLGRIGTRLGQWARAQLLLAIFFGVAFGAGLRLAGVKYAVTLGLIGGVLEVIPYVGGFITVALALLVAVTQDPVKVIWVIAWYTVVVELEGHVIAPKLMDRVLGIHPLVVVIALFLGGEALGIFGALLAVPIAIVVQVVLDEFYVVDRERPAPQAASATAPPAVTDAKSLPQPRPPERSRERAGRR
jgi:predicted PurR-regulated permease PerM